MSESATLTASTRNIVGWLFDPSTPLEPPAEAAARLLLLDTLGCAIGGGDKPELRALNASMAALEPGEVRLPGMEYPLTAPAVAAWSAMAATWDEACEGLARAHGRPGLHAFPASVALTLARHGTLGDALTALVRGYEIGGRLGERFRIRPGLHVDGTWGTFGAVAAAGSVLGHDAEMVMATIEAAACQMPASLYLPVTQGATARNTYVAEAARRGIGLALSIGAGVTAPTGGLHACEEFGLFESYPANAIAPPGEWLVTQGYLKPYAAVRHVHYPAEAARRWHAPAASTTTDIQAIEIDVYPEALTYCGNRAPQTAISAQFSLTFGVAHMLVARSLGPEAYTAAALANPEIIRIERLINVRPRPGPTADHRYATLHVTSSSGDKETIHVDNVAGDSDNPMTVDAVMAKFVAYTSWLDADWQPEAVASAIVGGPLDASLSHVIGS